MGYSDVNESHKKARLKSHMALRAAVGNHCPRSLYFEMTPNRVMIDQFWKGVPGMGGDAVRAILCKQVINPFPHT